MNRIKYVDMLKVIAIFSIILLHVLSIFDTTEVMNLAFTKIKQIPHFGIPLFLMITGMLTLNKDIDLKVFFKKKFVRIVYPLVFFFAIAYVLHIYTEFLTTYWYCWMVIGVYLAIPLLNILIKHIKPVEMDYFILLIIITSLIYSITYRLGIRIALDLDFFVGPTAYLVLGYYLSRKEFNMSANKMALISLVIFIAVSIFKVYFNKILCINGYGHIYSLLNVSTLQIIQVASIFLFFRYLYECSKGIFGKIRQVLETNYINKIILSISRSSYGIYLFHMLLLRGYIDVHFKNIPTTGTDTLIFSLVVSISLLIISWIGIVILGKIPVINKLSGYY